MTMTTDRPELDAHNERLARSSYEPMTPPPRWLHTALVLAGGCAAALILWTCLHYFAQRQAQTQPATIVIQVWTDEHGQCHYSAPPGLDMAHCTLDNYARPK